MTPREPKWPWHDPLHWEALHSGRDCPFCNRGGPDFVVCTLPTAWVSVPATACLAGYACVVHRRHVVELHELPVPEAARFVEDVCRVSRAVQRITGAVKVNLLSLGNLVPHLHVHVCPRRPGDRFEGRAMDPGDLLADSYTGNAHRDYAAALCSALSAPP